MRELGSICWRTVAACGLLCLSVAVTPQKSAPPVRRTFSTVENLVARLKVERAPSPLAATLKLTTCGLGDGNCQDRSFEIRHPRLSSTADTAVVLVKDLQWADLIALVRETTGTWRWAGTLPLRFAYEQLHLEFRSIVASGVDEIVVFNDTVGHGSGIYQGRLLIAKLLDGELRVVFAAADRSNINGWGPVDYQHSSNFTFAAPGKEPGAISEMSNYTIGARHYRIKRDYEWSDQLQLFAPGICDEITDVR